jgi:hypothetical protein
MHSSLARPFIVSTLVLVCAANARAQDAAKGASLLAQARQALGGEDKLRAVKTLQVKGDFKRLAGQNTIEGALEVRMERPDKLRRDEDLSPPGGGPAIVRTEVVNGTQVWDDNSGGTLGGFGGRGFGRGGFGGRRGIGPDAQAPGAPAPAIDPVQLHERQRITRQADLARFRLIWLLDTDAPAAWVGTAESPDGKADVLEIQTTDGPARLFLDQATHKPLMLTWHGAGLGRRGRGGDPAPPQPTLQMTLGEYKAFNGIQLPQHVTRGVNGQTLEEWNVKSYSINPSFKADVFNK